VAGRDGQGAARSTTVPLSAEARKALDHALNARPRIGDAPIFPHPKKPPKSVTHWYFRKWFEAAEQEAELPEQDGSLCHVYRRKWATERKHLPPQDVAEAGGWKGIDTLTRIYQQPNDLTLLRVVTERNELRDSRSAD
jgi:integrase